MLLNAICSSSHGYLKRGIIPDFDARIQPPPEWLIASQSNGALNDPKRAETLTSSMEVVSDDLVQRYQKLRTGSGEGEDDVDGCAICREGLLDLSPSVLESNLTCENYAALPFHPESDCVLAFPCAGKHLFHRDCLFPWLSWKTTCPTCRFDIDPLSLTLRLPHMTPDGALIWDEQPASRPPTRIWQPPRTECMSDWLAAEELVQATGVPRERPNVQMPECE